MSSDPLENKEDHNRPSDVNIVYRDGEKVRLSRPYLMGILNVTLDSFFDGGRFFQDRTFFKKAEEMMLFGVDIIDIGGESTRPGALFVPLAEERRRVIPKLKKLKRRFPKIRVSIDTSKIEIATEAIAFGADLINDVSAGDTSNNAMLLLAARTQTPIVIMHKKGLPETMQHDVQYDNVAEEVFSYLQEKIKFLDEAGIDDGKVIIDVGIGFGKEKEHNIALIRALPTFKKLKKPILIGASMKSLLYHIAGATLEDRLPGTLAVHLSALIRGAHIIRVHDVKAAYYSTQSFFAIESFHGL